jgi:hypothetical protein
VYLHEAIERLNGGELEAALAPSTVCPIGERGA